MATPFERTPFSEVIPESVNLKGLTKSSILTGRRRVRVIPQTGTSYGPDGNKPMQCNILLQDSAGLLDLQSCVLSFRLRTSTANNIDPEQIGIPDDFAWSVLQRLQLSLNSVLIDDVDYCGRRATMEAYSTGSRSWYSSIGSIMGAWKFVEGRPNITAAAAAAPAIKLVAGVGAPLNPVLSVAAAAGPVVGASGTNSVVVTGDTAAAIPKNDVVSKFLWANIWFKNLSYGGAPAAWSAGEGQLFAIPLSCLSHFFKQTQYFPLRNAGQLYIQLLFAQANQCIYGVATSAATYSVTDLVMECDIVTAHPEFTALLDEICARPEKEGLAMAYDSHLVSQQTPGAGGRVTVIASKASQNLRSLHFTMMPANAIGVQTYFQNSTFNSNDITQFQMRVGSQYYPAFPSQGLSRNYMELLNSFNSPSRAVGQDCLIDYDQYRGTCSAAGVDANPLLYSHAASWVSGICFDNLKHAEVLTHDGINTLSQSGSQIAVDVAIRDAAGNVGAVTTYIRFTRVILFAESGVQVLG